VNSRGRIGKRITDDWWVVIPSVAGILACLGDLIMTHLLGTWYHGYRPLFQSMSDLGDEGSPVAGLASDLWLVFGVMFVLFGYGFYRAFSQQGKTARTAAWMIAVYGFGEEVGSGLVPGTPGGGFQTANSIGHNIVGGIGVLAIVSLPFLIMKLHEFRKSLFLYCYSWFTTVTGIFFFVLFVVSQFYHPAGSWIIYHGLWQRLFMLTYYLYLMCLALLMLTREKWNREAGSSMP
jgi:hypothetical protein